MALGFRKLKNFTYDDKDLPVWRAYDVEPGEWIPFDDCRCGAVGDNRNYCSSTSLPPSLPRE